MASAFARRALPRILCCPSKHEPHRFEPVGIARIPYHTVQQKAIALGLGQRIKMKAL
jgi:hypothetical protein